MIKPKKIKTGSGIRWEVSFYTDGRGSKRVRRRFIKKLDAEDFIKDYFLENDFSETEKTKDDAKICFYNEFEFWLLIRGEEISPSYKRRVQGIIDNLKDSYPNLRVGDLNSTFMTRIRRVMLKSGAAPATINRWTTSIIAVLNFSVKHNRLSKNPVMNFKPLNEFRDEINYLEEYEAKKFLEYSREKYDINSEARWVYVVYLLALNTGLRAGEIWGLKVKDLNPRRKIISIERQFLHRERKISTTKGKKSRRVPCNSVLLDELLNLIQKANLNTNDFIFRNRKNHPVFHYNFRNRFFLKDIRESGVTKIRFHDLRHTALTLMVSKGININVVQSIAGHSDIKTTMKYVHLLANDIENVSLNYSVI